MSGLRVWYDHKRECYVSNAGMILAKNLGVSPYQAALVLLGSFKSEPGNDIWNIVEEIWVS